MALNTQTKILLIAAAIFLLIFFLYYRTSEGFSSIGAENNTPMIPENVENHPIEDDAMGPIESTLPVSPTDQSGQYIKPKDYSPPETDWLSRKFDGRNKAKACDYKRSSYSAARRGDLGPSDWDAYFDHNNNIIGNSQTGDNDKFLPVDESNGKLAVFKTKGRATCGSNQNCEPEDLFDVDKYLPQEVNDDWFEVQPEPISVKNRHLINITKPIGINTIGTSLKNASYDLRGSPSCPKFVVSPWLQSSIEPDTNLKPLY